MGFWVRSAEFKSSHDEFEKQTTGGNVVVVVVVVVGPVVVVVGFRQKGSIGGVSLQG